MAFVLHETKFFITLWYFIDYCPTGNEDEYKVKQRMKTDSQLKVVEKCDHAVVNFH